MEDDGEPVAAVSFGDERHQPTEHDIARETPRHVEVIHPKNKAVGNPIPFPKDTFHLGQQHAAEQEFFAQEVVEQRCNHKERKEIPRANPTGMHFRGEQYVQAAAWGFHEKGKERCPNFIEKRRKPEFQRGGKKQ